MLLSIVIHLLFAGALALAGAVAGRALAAPWWWGGLFGLAIYALAVAADSLADRPARNRSKPDPRPGHILLSGGERDEGLTHRKVRSNGPEERSLHVFKS